MIRVYLDWNVMAQMKGGYQDDLHAILSQKDRFFVPYSTSHIGDLLSNDDTIDDNQRKRIDYDLNFISTLTNNYCLSNSGSQVHINTYDPHSIYQDRVDDKDLLNDFTLGKIEELFTIDGYPDISKSLVSMLKSIPIDDVFREALKNPETSGTINQIFPDLSDNPTMEGFFQSFGKMIKNLNETEDYENLRELTRDGLGINRDKMFNTDDPFDLIEKNHSKYGLKWDDYIDKDKHAPRWFNEITNAYLKLDMHGYQEDKVQVKPKKRKQTFKNTTEDGFHAAFASTCHFYIVNDKRAVKKTRQVYKHLNINTLVFKPQEFIDYCKEYLGLTVKSIGDSLKTIVDIINTKNYIETRIEEGVRRTYNSPHFIFDFFNGVVLQKEEKSREHINMLFRNMPTNSFATFAFEVRELVKRINVLLGLDENEFGEISDDELRAENWVGLSWQLNIGELRLLGFGGNIQLYLNFSG